MGFLATIVTFAPSFVASIATHFPIPLEPPVTCNEKWEEITIRSVYCDTSSWCLPIHVFHLNTVVYWNSFSINN